jgi:hypothetical protein
MWATHLLNMGAEYYIPLAAMSSCIVPLDFCRTLNWIPAYVDSL